MAAPNRSPVKYRIEFNDALQYRVLKRYWYGWRRQAKVFDTVGEAMGEVKRLVALGFICLDAKTWRCLYLFDRNGDVTLWP